MEKKTTLREDNTNKIVNFNVYLYIYINKKSDIALYLLPGDGEYCPWFSGAFYLFDLNTHTKRK